MSIRQVLADQYKYPLPNSTPMLTVDANNNVVVVQDAVQYINVPFPPLEDYGLDPLTVQVFASQVGSRTSTALISGLTNFDPVGNTIDVAICYVNETPVDIKLFFVPEKLV